MQPETKGNTRNQEDKGVKEDETPGTSINEKKRWMEETNITMRPEASEKSLAENQHPNQFFFPRFLVLIYICGPAIDIKEAPQFVPEG